MVAFNVSLDDSSPLIGWSGTWVDTPANDTLAANYTSASFHVSDSPGAAVSFRFNGTGVWLYGAHRPGYGTYTLAVDGHTILNGSAASSSPLFDQLLGGSSNMTMGEHTAVLTSTGGGAIDVDSLVFRTRLGRPGQQVSAKTIDDTAQSVSYLPSSPAWSTANNEFFANGSVHFSQAKGAEASISFSGDAVAVYGGVSFDHGNYTVTVDGKSQALNGGTARTYHPQSLLYFDNSLGSGNHSLTITVDSGFFDLDAIKVYSAVNGTNQDVSIPTPDTPTSTAVTTALATLPSSGGMQLPMVDNGSNTDPVNQADHAGGNGNGASSSAPSSSKFLSKAALGGIIAAAALGFIILLLLVIIAIRKRRQRPHATQRIVSPVLPIQRPDLEAGIREKTTKTALGRSGSKWTTRTAKSRWSQESFVSGGSGRHEHLEDVVPPVPQIPRVNTPIPRRSGSGRDSSPSSDSDNSRASVVRGDDGSVDGYSYRNSYASTSTSSVAPSRPPRPPRLDLRELGPDFEPVSLSS